MCISIHVYIYICLCCIYINVYVCEVKDETQPWPKKDDMGSGSR